MHSSYIFLFAPVVLVLAAPHDQTSRLKFRTEHKSSDGMIITIDDAASGAEKRTTLVNRKDYKSKDGMIITISDATPGVSEKRDHFQKRTTDGISSCGPTSGWIPLEDKQGPATGWGPWAKEGPWFWLVLGYEQISSIRTWN